MSTTHRKSSMGKSRDFGTGNNGKGDGDRTSNTAAYAANFDAIDWTDKRVKIDAHVHGFTALTSPNGPDNTAIGYVAGVLNTAPNPALEDFESWDR